MSIWGKIAGAAAGFALGGPLGALLGSVAGHFTVDRERERERDGARPPRRDVAFTIAVIALSAKMAKADGVVTSDEVAAFRDIFHVPPEELVNVRRIYNLARQDVAGYDAYARQVARLFGDEPAVLEDLLDGLFHIAKADGEVHPSELAFLKEVARIFGFTGLAFEHIAARHTGGVESDPFGVLGLRPDASDAEVKSTYRRLVRETHPDALIARGVPAEFVTLATDRLAAINGAYERIRAERAEGRAPV